MNVAIIGSGLAGMIFGRNLLNLGYNISIFDKSRGPGGRLASKRSKYGDFDFGAQYFTCRSNIFKEQIDDWLEREIVKEWNVQPGVINSPGSFSHSSSKIIRFVGCPKMTSISRDIEKDIGEYISYNKLVTSIEKTVNGKWKLEINEKSNNNEYDFVVINTPPLQALPFVKGITQLEDICKKVTMNPCWAISFTFNESLSVPFDCAFVNCNNISWISKNNSKPNRETSAETWVIHGNIEWSKSHLEDSPESITKKLYSDFFNILQIEKKNYIHSIVHRWRYSIASNPLSDNGYIFDESNKIGLCGDWCNQGKVEGAYLSGYNLFKQFQNTYKQE